MHGNSQGNVLCINTALRCHLAPPPPWGKHTWPRMTNIFPSSGGLRQGRRKACLGRGFPPALCPKGLAGGSSSGSHAKARGASREGAPTVAFCGRLLSWVLLPGRSTCGVLDGSSMHRSRHTGWKEMVMTTLKRQQDPSITPMLPATALAAVVMGFICSCARSVHHACQPRCIMRLPSRKGGAR